MLKYFNCRPSPCKSHYLSRTTTAAPLPCRIFSISIHSLCRHFGLGNPRFQQYNELLQIVGIQFPSFYAYCICAVIHPAFPPRTVSEKYYSTAFITIFRCSPDTDRSDCRSPSLGLILISVTFTCIQSQPDSWLTYAFTDMLLSLIFGFPHRLVSGDRLSESCLILAIVYLYCCLYGRTFQISRSPRNIEVMDCDQLLLDIRTRTHFGG